MRPRSLFGDDIFISYSRKDGSVYAAGLADKLTERKFSCFLDLLGTDPAPDLPPTLIDNIKRCSMCVLVGTKQALVSEHVKKEIEEFNKTKRTIIPIYFEGTPETSPLSTLIPGLARSSETKEALTSGDPSPSVVNRIEKSFNYTRRDQRMRRNLDTAVVVLWILLTASIIAAVTAITNTARASEQAKLAEEEKKRADQARETANEAQKEADRQIEIARDAEQRRIAAENKARDAEGKMKNAVDQQQLAERRTKDAEKQRELAEVEARKRQWIASSRELASSARSQLLVDPELSALLAVEAIKQARTAEAEDILRQSLSETYVRVVKRTKATFTNHPVFSPDGKLIANVSRDNIEQVWQGGDIVQVWKADTGQTVVELRGHTNLITDMAFSPDGKYLVTASFDRTARVWQTDNWQQLTELRGHTGEINCIAFSPDGRRVITGSNDQTAQVWEVRTGQPVAKLSGAAGMGMVSYAAFSPDGKLIVTVGGHDMRRKIADDHIRVWDASTYDLVTVIEADIDRESGRPEFSPDSRHIMAVTSDKILIWDALNGKEAAQLITKARSVRNARFSPDGKRVVAVSFDDTARIWALPEMITSNIPVAEIPSLSSTGGDQDKVDETLELRGHTGQVNIAVFSPDSKLIITVSDDWTARVWQASNGVPLAELRGHTGPVRNVAFSADGRRIVTISWDGTARVWEVEGYRIAPDLIGHKRWVKHAGFSPDGKMVVTASYDHTARVWEASTGKPIAKLSGHTDIITSAAFSPDGKLVITSSADGTVRTWQALTGAPGLVLGDSDAALSSAAFSPDGQSIVTIVKSSGQVRVWEASTGKLKYERKVGSSGEPVTAVFSHDGRLLVTSGRTKSQVWEADTGEPVFELLGGSLQGIHPAFSPDDSLIITEDAFRGTAQVWDVKTHRLVKNLEQQWMLHPIFSPDGKLILTVTDRTIRVWEVGTWYPLTELRGYTGSGESAVFSPDSKFIVTAGSGGTAEVWDARTGRSLLTLPGISNTLEESSTALSPDGKLLITGADGNTAHVYACDVCVSVEKLCAVASQRLTRELTDDERKLYLTEPQIKERRESVPWCAFDLNRRTANAH